MLSLKRIFEIASLTGVGALRARTGYHRSDQIQNLQQKFMRESVYGGPLLPYPPSPPFLPCVFIYNILFKRNNNIIYDWQGCRVAGQVGQVEYRSPYKSHEYEYISYNSSSVRKKFYPTHPLFTELFSAMCLNSKVPPYGNITDLIKFKNRQLCGLQSTAARTKKKTRIRVFLSLVSKFILTSYYTQILIYYNIHFVSDRPMLY